jgi:hypothetical protein
MLDIWRSVGSGGCPGGSCADPSGLGTAPTTGHPVTAKIVSLTVHQHCSVCVTALLQHVLHLQWAAASHQSLCLPALQPRQACINVQGTIISYTKGPVDVPSMPERIMVHADCDALQWQWQMQMPYGC